MATKEDQDHLRLLVQHVSRAFYDAKYTIIMDQLARHPVLKDDDLASKMGLQPKELNKVIAQLANDCLVKVYRQNELKEGAQRSVGRQYYYIDYEHFCNVVKWRIAKMRGIIDSTLRNELDNKGYICPTCHTSYSPLDADKLISHTLGALICEICKSEVVDNDDSESVLGSKDRMQRFNHQMRWIREGLQRSEAMTLPAFDVALWVKKNLTAPTDGKSSSDTSGLKIAGSDPSKNAEDGGIGIMMALDKDEETRKEERKKEAEVKRQQNALPAWHLKSTITGDLTALGVKESVRQGGGVGVDTESGSGTVNDEILRGLGVVGGSKADVRGGGAGGRGVMEVQVREDVKPSVGGGEEDYFDQYYARLAAASSNPSSLPSAIPSTAVSAQATPTSSDFAVQEEEEDRKPNVEYLDSLNDYRKRSRSREDEGVRGDGKVKAVRLDEPVVNGFGLGHGLENGVVPMQMDDGELNGDGVGGGEDDPIVYVNGKPVPYSQVTEEDHDLMTPEEYTAFFEVMQTRS